MPRSPRVINARTEHVEPGAVWCDRRGPWGNPFIIGRDAPDRRSVVRMHKEWFLRQPGLLARLDELRGRDLVCWCDPAACHVHVIFDLANGPRL